MEQMPPFLCGGEMIDSVSRTGAVWAEVPHKFEAGTVNGAGAYALAEAIRYVQKIGFDFIEEREAKLTAMLMDGMKEIPAVHILGSQKAERPSRHCDPSNWTVCIPMMWLLFWMRIISRSGRDIIVPSRYCNI